MFELHFVSPNGSISVMEMTDPYTPHRHDHQVQVYEDCLCRIR